MFEKSEILSWVKETSFGEKIFAIIVKEIKGTKSMTKVLYQLIGIHIIFL